MSRIAGWPGMRISCPENTGKRGKTLQMLRQKVTRKCPSASCGALCGSGKNIWQRAKPHRNLLRMFRGVLDRSRDLLWMGDIDRVARARYLNRVTVCPFGIPPLQLRIDGSV